MEKIYCAECNVELKNEDEYECVYLIVTEYYDEFERVCNHCRGEQKLSNKCKETESLGRQLFNHFGESMKPIGDK